MQSIFEKNTFKAIQQRIQQLSPDAKALWGKMTVAQMLAHCTEGMKMAAGEIHLPRVFLGRIVGRFLKDIYYNEKPFPKHINTDKALVIREDKDFKTEQQRLLDSVEKFHIGGPEKCTKTPHPFLGDFTPEQWAMGMYKHLDHHLRQFGA